MTHVRISLLALVVSLGAGMACSFAHSANAIAPADTNSAGSFVGTWQSTSVTGVIGASTCTNFTWTVGTQTSTTLTGTFSATCTGGVTATGTASGQLIGTTIPLTVTGSASLPGVTTNCPFSLSSTALVETDDIRIPYTGTTCLGPVSGVEVLHKTLNQPPPPVIIQAPAMVSPADGASVTVRPTLVVTNAATTGPAGALSYLFQVSTDGAFGSQAASGTVNEGSSQTQWSVASDLAQGTKYYWRARAADPNNVGAWSNTRSFSTPAIVVVPPPPPWPDQIDFSAATIQNSPHDLASWPITTGLTTIDMGGNGVHVEFSKQDGPDRWPDVTPAGWTGSLQYTLGMALNINGHWYASAVVEFWYGLYAAGGPPQDYALNWFYDPIRWGPMSGYQPAVGETIGFFVCAGDCRNNLNGSYSPVRERSNVVLVQMPGPGGAVVHFVKR